jgi:hypothetical protein
MAETALAMLKEHCDGRTGGYIVVYNPQEWTGSPDRIVPVVAARIGKIPKGKEWEKFAYAREKALRLLANPNMQTTSEDERPEHGMWGGGIRVNTFEDVVIAFSGLPPMADEAVSLRVALHLRFTHEVRAEELAKLWGNDLFKYTYSSKPI